MMDRKEKYLASLEEENPFRALHHLASELVKSGADRQALIAELEALRPELRLAAREDAEDTVLEVMECLAGWSSPHTQI